MPPLTRCVRLMPPPRRHPPPSPWRGFAPRRRYMHCRELHNNAITAIPSGLFDFTTALLYLYGHHRPTMSRGRAPTYALASVARCPRQPRRPSLLHALIDFNCLHTLPRCQSHAAVDPVCTTYAPSASPPAAVAVAWVCHPPPVYALQVLEQQRHHGDP